MANLYTDKQRQKKSTPSRVGQRLEVDVNAMDHHGLGVCTAHQPPIFIASALPNERVDIQVTSDTSGVLHGKTLKVIEANAARVVPTCQYYNECGGCHLQHGESAYVLSQKQDAVAQLILKQKIPAVKKTQVRKKGQLLNPVHRKSDRFRTLADYHNELPWLPSITSPAFGYRRKSRLAVDARNPDNIKVGFRQKHHKRIISVQECPVLVEPLQQLLSPLRDVMAQLQRPNHVGHLELFHANECVQLAVREVKTLPDADKQLLTDFAISNGVSVILQSNQGSEALHLAAQTLTISLDDTLQLNVTTDDFVQVNDTVNRAMIQQAIRWLKIDENDAVLDLYCGLGNFTLPIASIAGWTTGVEGVENMVTRAQANARENQIDRCDFIHLDLTSIDSLQNALNRDYNKVLLDPAREGALAISEFIGKSNVEQVLYVSCNPATFARDCAALYQYKFRIQRIAVMDMFPQTAHTELMALFVRT